MLGLAAFVGLIAAWSGLCLLLAWLHGRGTMRHDWHRDAASIGVLGLVTLSFFWPLFFAESWIPKGGGDLSSFIYPTYAFAARWLRRGVVPLWNPHLYMGMPFAADNQSGLFYPLNLLLLALPDLTYEAVELMAVAHVFLAGLFTYVLLRDLPSPRVDGKAARRDDRRPMGRIPALAGAMTYMLSDLFVVHLGNLNIIATAAWLPLALLSFRRAILRRSWGWAACSGIVLGVAALVGHAQMLLYIGASLALFAAFQAGACWNEAWRDRLVRAGLLALTAAVAFGLAAISLVPAYDMTHYTVRASLSYEEASKFAIPPAGLVSILVPGFFGRGTGPFWGPWPRTETGYVGILPLVLAAVAIALTWRRYTLTRFWVLLGAFGLLVALGPYAIVHGLTYAIVPVFRQLRVPARAIVLFDFGVAALAATGLDVLLHPLTRKARAVLSRLSSGLWWPLGILALVGVPVLGHAVLVSRSAVPADVLMQHVTSMGSLVFMLLVLGAALGGLMLRRGGLARPVTLGVLALCVIALDLLSLGAYVEVEPNDPLVGYRHDEVLAFLRADPEVYRVETLAEVQGEWAPDWALLHEIDDYGGIWNPLRLGAYDVLTWVGIQRKDAFYDLYNVKYLIASRETPVPPHFELVLEDGGVRIYRNARVLPRAYVVHDVREAGGDIAALSIARSPEFDPRTQIVLKQGSGAELPEQAAGGATSAVVITERAPNRLEFSVTTSADGYLFVSEMWMPGWVAYVDGDRQDVLQANYTFRAVRVPAGTHTVEMVYRPTSWFLGLGITLFTVGSLAIWGLWSLVRRWRGRR